MTQWYISVRDNATLLLKDTALEQTFESLSITKRFNDVGTWVLQLRKEDAHYSTFAPVSGVLPNVGLLVYVDNEDGNGLQLVMSGPMTDIDVKSQADNTQPVLITGVSDEYYLRKRRAFQVPHYPYLWNFTNNATKAGSPDVNWISPYNVSFPAPIRFYPCNDTSGTTAVDWGTQATNATYQGGFTLNSPGLIDDPSTCVLLNGTSGLVNVNTTSLPTGNNGWTFLGWGMVSSYVLQYMWGFGTNAAKQNILFGIDGSGHPVYGGNSITNVTDTNVVPLNEPFLLAITYDGTTLRGYHYSSNSAGQFGTSTPGTMNITYGNCLFGESVTSGVFWNGSLGMGGIFNYAQGSTLFGQMYAVGKSRQTYTFDANNASTLWSSFTNASTGLIYYVQRNASATASPVSADGTAQPVSSFTNWTGTHTARPIPNLSIASDPSVGSTIRAVIRFDNLLYLLGALALQSSPELGFKLEQSGTSLVFTVYAPSDLTSTAIFSRDLYGATGNILEYSWKLSTAVATHIIAGGSNFTTAWNNRLFWEGENSTGITNSGYLEDFLDYRQTGDFTTLAQAITGQLAADAQILNINATLIDQPGVLYFKGPSGKGYDLGNKVRVLLDGQTFDEVIREIDITLEPGKPAIITPAIGTPLRAEIISEYDTVAQNLRALGVQTSALRTFF